MNILYLLKTIKTNKLSELVAVIDAPPLDVNLAIWEAMDRGEIEVDDDKDRVKALKDAEPWQNDELANKLVRVVQHYARQELNITRGRLDGYIKEPISDQGYPMHEYLMTRQALVDSGTLVEEVVTVPKTKSRPFRRFVFLCLPENDNAEWNAKAVSKWMDDFAKEAKKPRKK